MTLKPTGRTLRLGYSPCPNDTFIFYALVHHMIDTAGLGFEEILLDVETLNKKAMEAELDVTKVSFHAFGFLKERYALLCSGGALGRGCGPLVVAKEKAELAALAGRKIAIPGRLTTAFLLLQLCDPSLAQNVVVMPFHEIMGAVKSGEVDAGLIIHESRFTYPEYGLSEIADLGKWWEDETGLPIPLGCIIAKRSLGKETILTVERFLRESIEYAFAHREETGAYIRAHSQEMEESVVRQHVDLYVNDYSLDLANDGMHAVEELLKRAGERGIIPGGKNAFVR